MTIPLWLQAGLWGWVAGAALLIGAAAGWWLRVSPRMVAGIMAFGSGVLISAMAFDLMDDAFQRGGILPAKTRILRRPACPGCWPELQMLAALLLGSCRGLTPPNTQAGRK